MKRIRHILLIIPAMLLFTSCLELYEKIQIKEGGKGSIEMGFDLGNLGFMGHLAGKYLKPALMQEITAMPKAAADKLSAVKGITSVKHNADLSKGRIYVSFDFNNSKALSKAYYALFFREKRWYEPKPVLISKKRMKRYNLSPIIKYFVNKNKEQINDMKFLGFINVRSEIITSRPVKSISNPLYKIIPGGKGAEMKIGLQELINNTPNTGIKLRY